jgi:peptide/nickel transport system permease protein
MQTFIIRRLIAVPITILISSFIVFAVTRMMPGKLVDLILTATDYDLVDDEVRAAIAKRLGLDLPIPQQYLNWISDLVLRGDLGLSLNKEVPVMDEILRHLPNTAELGTLALLFACVLGLTVGIFSALRPESLGDHLARGGAILGLAIPGFWLGTLAVVLPSLWWGWTPPLEVAPLFEDPWLNLQKYWLPAAILGLAYSAVIMRMTRTMMLEVLNQDYIRTAWAKGQREHVIILRHALKNAMIPVISLIGLLTPTLVGGTVIIENIFNIPGLGSLLLEAIGGRDHPMISGIFMIFALIIISVNLMVDLSYGFLDPKVRYE